MKPDFAQRHWYRRSPLSVLLYPASLLFGIAVRARRALFRYRLLASTAMPVPVIVVGNVTVGGTGKTPLVLWLVRALSGKGCRPGVIVSGYGGSAREPARVLPGDDPGLRGDEAVLMARLAGVPVWSGRDRVLCAQALLRAHPDCTLLVCDDGLQHYRLRRDIEIAVEDERGMGNGYLLPAGPLREPADRRVDARVVNAGQAPVAGGFSMQLEPSGFYRLDDPGTVVDASRFRGRRVHAIAGIGAPERFFSTLRLMGVDAICHAFPDHHDFIASDLAFSGCDVVLMTEKDAVKCERLAGPAHPVEGEGVGTPPVASPEMYALRVEARLDPGFLPIIEKRLNGLKAT